MAGVRRHGENSLNSMGAKGAGTISADLKWASCHVGLEADGLIRGVELSDTRV